jgi:FixJ family two-component response regulator
MNNEPTLVAVVDDEESVRRALGRLIRSAGYAVEMFGSGVDFMQSLKRMRPDCVVMDLRMPVLSGFELQAALLRSGVAVPVVFITGDDSPDSRDRALRCGARAFLRKPVDDALLIEAIQNAVRDPA